MTWISKAGGHWGIWRGGFMLNEGAGPVNLSVLFPWSSGGVFVYIFFFGRRWVWPKRVRPTSTGTKREESK